METGKFTTINSPEDQLWKKNDTDAGLDIRSAEDCIIGPLERKLVSTGLYIKIPDGCYAQIKDRSGLAYKHGITVLSGVVDQEYRGEVKILLYNTDKNNLFTIHKGDRIAQLITISINQNRYTQVDSLNETTRGECGFGSSGVQ